jgi:hypothetical protein
VRRGTGRRQMCVRGDGAGSVCGLLPAVCGSFLAITWLVTGIWVERQNSKARK